MGIVRFRSFFRVLYADRNSRLSRYHAHLNYSALCHHLCEPLRRVAHAWFLRAAEQGHAQAEYFTYFCSDSRGPGTADYLWLTRAARHGQADAQEALAREILAGKQTRESVLDAARWLERAARNDSGAAAEMLGDVLASNKPLSRNPQAALDWYRQALTIQNKALGEVAPQLLEGLQDKIRRIEAEQQAK